MTEETFLQIYNGGLVLVGFYIGIFCTFFTSKFLELNAKLYRKMGMHKQAEHFSVPYMYFLAKGLGIFFLLAAISTVVRVLFGITILPINIF